MISIRYDFSPVLREVVAEIELLALDVRSFKEPLERSVRQVMIPSIAKNFEEGGRPDAWEPLSSETIRIKEQQGYPENILVRSGKLKQAATQINIWKVSREEAVLTGLPDRAWYGAIHQEGGDAGRAGTLPARPFFVMQPEDEEKIGEIFHTWLWERVTLATARWR